MQKDSYVDERGLIAPWPRLSGGGPIPLLAACPASPGSCIDSAAAGTEVEAGEKAQDALQKDQANFEQAQQEVVEAQTDLDKLMQEALLPVIPVPQVNVSLAKTLEALIGIVENMWNPDAGQPPDQYVQSRSPGQSFRPHR